MLLNPLFFGSGQIIGRASDYNFCLVSIIFPSFSIIFPSFWEMTATEQFVPLSNFGNTSSRHCKKYQCDKYNNYQRKEARLSPHLRRTRGDFFQKANTGDSRQLSKSVIILFGGISSFQVEIHIFGVSAHFLGGQNMTVWAILQISSGIKTAPKAMAMAMLF